MERFVKIRSIKFFLVIIFSITFGNLCRGMWIVPIVQTALPLAPYMYIVYKMVQSKINGYRRLEEKLDDVHEDVKQVDIDVKQEAKETRQDIKDSKTHLSDKIDEAKDQLIKKIDDSRGKLEELINTKIEEAKTSINSHIGLTKFDILKNIQDIEKEFKKRLDKIDGTLENCVTPDDVQAAKEGLNGTIEDMKHMLGDMITKSEQQVTSCIKKELLKKEERQNKLLEEKITFLDKKNELRGQELKKQNNSSNG